MCTITTDSTYAWWSENAGNYEASTTDIAAALTTDTAADETFSITITAKDGGTTVETHTINIQLVNPCQTTPTTISAHSITDQTIYLDASTEYYAVGDFIDTVGGDASFCGSRTYTFSDPVLLQDVTGTLGYTTGTWSLQAASPTYSASLTPLSITVTVNVAYASTATVTRDFTFNVIIKHLCWDTVI